MSRIDYGIAHVVFGQDKIWQTLSQGLARSIFKNTHAEGIVQRIQTPEVLINPPQTHAKPQYMANAHKLRYWRNLVYNATEPLVLMDADCLVLEDLSHVWGQHPQDIILTDRDNKWVNGGVVFVRPTETSRKFFDDWVLEDSQVLFKDRRSRKPNTKYHIVGQNQISLWNIYQDWKDMIGWVPCQRYNSCEDRYWQRHQTAAVMHIKSGLRTELKRALSNKKVRRYPELIGKILPYYLDRPKETDLYGANAT